MNLNKLIFTIILVLLIVAGISCTKGKLVGEYYLSDQMKAHNPFKGFENLTFFVDSSNKIVFEGENRINEITTYAADNKGLDYVYAEDDYIVFLNDSIQLSINMNVAFYGNKLDVMMYYKNEGFIYYSNYDLFQMDTQINYLDSLLVNGLWMTDVYYDTMMFSFAVDNPIQLESYPIKSYYNAESGVVKIDFSDSLNWELENIEW